MKLKTAFLTAALFAFVMLGSGCTIALWHNDIIDSWNEPATDSHVRLFQSQPPEKILVVYTEHCGHKDAMRTQAYWLDENRKQPERHQAPHFVSTNSCTGLTAIPVFLSPPEPPNLPPFYAVTATNGQSFSLYSGKTKTASHNLPSYDDSTGEVEKVLLTPVAVAGDLTIIGGVIGYIYVGGLGGN
ncbi:MAG TPA: hypothetical protein VH597_02915 [Verrucomicrobiae bacterium]|jgi:hypothetical protein|nr:hypothetical protein [Verrucomicrobiae bacterium]